MLPEKLLASTSAIAKWKAIVPSTTPPSSEILSRQSTSSWKSGRQSSKMAVPAFGCSMEPNRPLLIDAQSSFGLTSLPHSEKVLPNEAFPAMMILLPLLPTGGHAGWHPHGDQMELRTRSFD